MLLRLTPHCRDVHLLRDNRISSMTTYQSLGTHEDAPNATTLSSGGQDVANRTLGFAEIALWGSLQRPRRVVQEYQRQRNALIVLWQKWASDTVLICPRGRMLVLVHISRILSPISFRGRWFPTSLPNHLRIVTTSPWRRPPTTLMSQVWAKLVKHLLANRLLIELSLNMLSLGSTNSRTVLSALQQTQEWT